MHRVALVFFSRLEGAGISATYRGLMFAQELQRAGDDVALVFDGAGTTALAALVQPEHRLHPLFDKLRARVRGGCRHCAQSYGVLGALHDAGLALLDDDRGHASRRALLLEGRQIVTF